MEARIEEHIEIGFKSRFQQYQTMFKGKDQQSHLLQLFENASLTPNEDSVESDPLYKLFLKWILTHSPINDLLDNDFSFFRRNIVKTLQIYREYYWAQQIPIALFLTYVLPLRVNNENLDEARIELQPLIQKFYNTNENNNDLNKIANFSEIVLLVNNFCNSQVIYQSSNNRTLSPLSVFNNGFGRCGEESTLLVAALRAVGIAARQVYVPRWSHCDDNHAWVECFDFGQQSWRFTGACEPEPILDKGWFNKAASRAMLVHSKSFGNLIDVSSQILCNRIYNNNFFETNEIERYVESSHLQRIKVVIVNKIEVNAQCQLKRKQKLINNNSNGILVQLLIYNDAQLFVLSEKTADEKGEVTFLTGKGTCFVSAICGIYFAFSQINNNNSTFNNNKIELIDQFQVKQITLELSLKEGLCANTHIEFYSIPPEEYLSPDYAKRIALDQEQETCKKNILDRNTSARTEYMELMHLSQVNAICRIIDHVQKLCHLKQFSNLEEEIHSRLSKIIESSRSNFLQVEHFILQCTSPQSQSITIPLSYCLQLLETLCQKDLCDISKESLLDYAIYSFDHYQELVSKMLNKDQRILDGDTVKKGHIDKEKIFKKYVLHPRIANEMLKPYKGILQQFFQNMLELVRKNEILIFVQQLLKWAKENLTFIENHSNYGGVISPQGVLKDKCIDKASLQIFLVAVCRSCGVPARLSKGAQQVQIYNQLSEEFWNLNLSLSLGELQYKFYKMDENAIKIRFQLQSHNKQISQEKDQSDEAKYGVHFSISRYSFKQNRFLLIELEHRKHIFDKTLLIRPGYYQLVTGHRDESGEVSGIIQQFGLFKTSNYTFTNVIHVHILRKNLTELLNLAININSEYSTFNKMIVIFCSLQSEPSQHLLHDLKQQQQCLGRENVKVIIYSDDQIQILNNMQKELELSPSIFHLFQTRMSLQELLSTQLLAKTNQQNQNKFTIAQIINSNLSNTKIEQCELPVVLFIDQNHLIKFKAIGYSTNLGEIIIRQV